MAGTEPAGTRHSGQPCNTGPPEQAKEYGLGLVIGMMGHKQQVIRYQQLLKYTITCLTRCLFYTTGARLIFASINIYSANNKWDAQLFTLGTAKRLCFVGICLKLVINVYSAERRLWPAAECRQVQKYNRVQATAQGDPQTLVIRKRPDRLTQEFRPGEFRASALCHSA